MRMRKSMTELGYPCAPGRLGASGDLRKMLCQSGEQTAAVGGPDRGFDVVLRMGHQAQHVATIVKNSCDRINGAVHIPARIELAVRPRVAERDTTLAFQSRDGLGVGRVVALAVRHR